MENRRNSSEYTTEYRSSYCSESDENLSKAHDKQHSQVIRDDDTSNNVENVSSVKKKIVVELPVNLKNRGKHAPDICYEEAHVRIEECDHTLNKHSFFSEDWIALHEYNRPPEDDSSNEASTSQRKANENNNPIASQNETSKFRAPFHRTLKYHCPFHDPRRTFPSILESNRHIYIAPFTRGSVLKDNVLKAIEVDRDPEKNTVKHSQPPIVGTDTCECDKISEEPDIDGVVTYTRITNNEEPVTCTQRVTTKEPVYSPVGTFMTFHPSLSEANDLPQKKSSTFKSVTIVHSPSESSTTFHTSIEPLSLDENSVESPLQTIQSARSVSKYSQVTEKEFEAPTDSSVKYNKSSLNVGVIPPKEKCHDCEGSPYESSSIATSPRRISDTASRSVSKYSQVTEKDKKPSIDSSAKSDKSTLNESVIPPKDEGKHHDEEAILHDAPSNATSSRPISDRASQPSSKHRSCSQCCSTKDKTSDTASVKYEPKHESHEEISPEKKEIEPPLEDVQPARSVSKYSVVSEKKVEPFIDSSVKSNNSPLIADVLPPINETSNKSRDEEESPQKYPSNAISSRPISYTDSKPSSKRCCCQSERCSCREITSVSTPISLEPPPKESEVARPKDSSAKTIYFPPNPVNVSNRRDSKSSKAVPRESYQSTKSLKPIPKESFQPSKSTKTIPRESTETTRSSKSVSRKSTDTAKFSKPIPRQSSESAKTPKPTPKPTPKTSDSRKNIVDLQCCEYNCQVDEPNQQPIPATPKSSSKKLDADKSIVNLECCEYNCQVDELNQQPAPLIQQPKPEILPETPQKPPPEQPPIPPQEPPPESLEKPPPEPLPEPSQEPPPKTLDESPSTLPVFAEVKREPSESSHRFPITPLPVPAVSPRIKSEGILSPVSVCDGRCCKCPDLQPILRKLNDLQIQLSPTSTQIVRPIDEEDSYSRPGFRSISVQTSSPPYTCVGLTETKYAPCSSQTCSNTVRKSVVSPRRSTMTKSNKSNNGKYK